MQPMLVVNCRSRPVRPVHGRFDYELMRGPHGIGVRPLLLHLLHALTHSRAADPRSFKAWSSKVVGTQHAHLVRHSFITL